MAAHQEWGKLPRSPLPGLMLVCETDVPTRAFWSCPLGVRDIGLIILYLAAVPWSFLDPFVGVLFWAWISYFNPQDFTWGLASRIPIGYLVAIPTLIGLPFTKLKQLPPLTIQTGLLAALWLWFCLTSVNVFISPELKHHSVDTLDSLRLFTKMMLMLLVALVLITDFKRFRWWYLVTAGSFALFALKIAVWGVATGGQYRAYGPRNSMIYDNNDFGLAMNMVLPMFVGIARTEQSRVLRWCFWAAVPTGILAVILTYSRGALLGLVAALLALVMKSKRRWLALVAAVVLGFGVFAVAPGKWIERMQTLRNTKEDQSAQARFHSWRFSYRLFRDHPILGGGFNTFTPELYAHYNLLADRVQGPHSIYFEVLAEQGLPGFALFLTLGASCWWSCRNLARTFMRHAESGGLAECVNMAEYANMLRLSIIPFFVSGAFLGLAYFDLYYQVAASVILLKKYAHDLSWIPEELEVVEESPLPATSR